MTLRILLLASAALGLVPAQASAKTDPAQQPVATAATTVAPAELAKLVRDFTIPFQTFTLPNGLKVIVLTDHRVPMVYTSINYNVGSTFEPAGRSGRACSARRPGRRGASRGARPAPPASSACPTAPL